MKEIFKTIISDFQNILPMKDVKQRDIQIPLDSKKIISLTGPRRSGKTYLFYFLINQLLKKVPANQIIYINFEDERLNIGSEHLQLLLEAYFELNPKITTTDIYFFFDEIQVVPGWEKFVRRIYDTVSKHIFITGSSAKMLDQEIASSLRGRHLVYHLYPLSFKEYCNFNEIEHHDIYSTRKRALLLNQFNYYLQNGGFPELSFIQPELRLKTLQSYFDVMIFRDIIERYGIRQIVSLKYFIKKLFESISSEFSINKIYNELKSMGIRITRDRLYDFLDYVTDVFLFFVTYPYQKSLVKSQMSNKKIYAIDNGLVNAVTFSFSNDYGKLLENMMFLHLLRNGNEIFFIKNGFECDFILFDRDQIKKVVQVSYSLSNIKTKKRELQGLLKAMDFFGIDHGQIITYNEKEELTINEKTIRITPAWLYLLNAD